MAQSTFFSGRPLGTRAYFMVATLIASLMLMTSPVGTASSQADYSGASTSTITHNDGVCNLGNPATHQSAETAFEVLTADQLWEVTDCVSNTATIYFKLGSDIDVSAATTAPTGSPIGRSTVDRVFNGVLDGQNHRIQNIDMLSEDSGVGLFASLNNATISQLGISGTFLTTAVGESSGQGAGALAISSTGTLNITSVTNDSSVTGTNLVGGLIGRAQGVNINLTMNTGNISGSGAYVAGLVGLVHFSLNITSSINQGDISGQSYVGGLVGYAVEGASISSSRNSGDVTGSENWVAGLVGYVENNLDIMQSHNLGAITGIDSLGGLSGFAGFTTITDSSNVGSVTGHFNLGGLIGDVGNDATIYTSFNTGAISSSDSRVGGLAGYVGNDENFDFSYNTGAISGVESVGGLSGFVSHDSNLEGSYNTGTVSGTIGVGGLTGYVRGNSNIAASNNSGVVAGTRQNIGGLVGLAMASAIEESYNTGTISGPSYVGGLLGYSTLGGSIATSFNSGAISGTDSIGGLVGYVNEAGFNIGSSYNSGAVSGDQFAAGLVGLAMAGTLNSVYNAGQITGSQKDGLLSVFVQAVSTTAAYSTVDSAHTTTSTPAELRLAASYEGFDFAEVWGYGSCLENDGFPMLRALGQADTFYSLSCGENPAVGFLNSPTGLVAVANADGSVSLSWTAPEQSNTQVEHYAITWKLGARGWGITSAGTSITIEAERFTTTGGLGVSYSFTVRADNDSLVIYSTESEAVIARPLIAAAEVEPGDEAQNPVQERPKYLVNQRTLATFQTGSVTLTAQQKAQVKAAVDANPNAEKFICTGIRYFDQPMSVNIEVRKRAKAACEYAKELNPALSTWFQNKPTQARSFAGKVLLTIKSTSS